MTVLQQQGEVTPEEFSKIDDGKLYELINGQLLEKTLGSQAIRIANLLYWYLETFLRQSKLGVAFCENTFKYPFDGDSRIRRPDVAFISAARLPGNKIPAGEIPVAPDLAVEVISPNDLFYDVNQKVIEYLHAGVREVWLIDPQQRTVTIRRLGRETIELDANGTLTSPDLLPGFSVNVSEIIAYES